MVAAGERSEFDIKPPLGDPLLILSRGYFLKSFLQRDISTRQRVFEIIVFLFIDKLPKAIKPHLSVSSHIAGNPVPPSVFVYDYVIRLRRSCRPSRGLHSGEPRIRHRWICLQLSGARGVDNGQQRGHNSVKDCLKYAVSLSPENSVLVSFEFNIQCEHKYYYCQMYHLECKWHHISWYLY